MTDQDVCGVLRAVGDGQRLLVFEQSQLVSRVNRVS